MFQPTRTVGLILIVVGVVLALLGIVWGLGNMAAGSLRATGFILLLVLLLPVAAVLVGGGLFVLVKARAESAQMAEVAKERKLLNMVQTRGQVRISDVALETNSSREQVQQYIYDVVGKGLFTGYIDWKEGTLYSREAQLMRSAGACPNCGGKLELAGKGIVKCPYCGSEIFL